MNERSPGVVRAEKLNDELRDYEGFAFLLDEVAQVAARDRRERLEPQPPEPALFRTADEERAAQLRAAEAMLADAEVAAVVQQLRALMETRHAKAVEELFPSSDTATSAE